MNHPNQAPTSHQPLPEQLTPYAEAISQYDQALTPIEQQLRAGVQPDAIPGYLASGSDKHAFLIATERGPAVAKFLHVEDKRELHKTPAERICINAEPLVAGEGVEGLEQLLAVDPTRGEAGVMVTSYAPGKRTADASALELWKINKHHLVRLDNTLQAMRERGLHPHNYEGILFDPKVGFTFVDYELEDPSQPRRKKVGIDSTDTFVRQALADMHKINAMLEARQHGLSIPLDLIKTTGLRAMVQNTKVRKARELFQPDRER